MIYITITKTNKQITAIEVVGHSGYSVAGSDIVCAVVSTITQSLITGLNDVAKIQIQYEIDEDTPRLYLALPLELNEKERQLADVLTKTAYIGLKQAQDSYKKYIKLKEKHNDKI